MRPIKIFTDTCSDMTPTTRTKNDIVGIDFTIYYRGEEISADPWKEITPNELYNSLREGLRNFAEWYKEFYMKG